MIFSVLLCVLLSAAYSIINDEDDDDDDYTPINAANESRPF